jgi:hypothetical protein
VFAGEHVFLQDVIEACSRLRLNGFPERKSHPAADVSEPFGVGRVRVELRRADPANGKVVPVHPEIPNSTACGAGGGEEGWGGWNEWFVRGGWIGAQRGRCWRRLQS